MACLRNSLTKSCCSLILSNPSFLILVHDSWRMDISVFYFYSWIIKLYYFWFGQLNTLLSRFGSSSVNVQSWNVSVYKFLTDEILMSRHESLCSGISFLFLWFFFLSYLFFYHHLFSLQAIFKEVSNFIAWYLINCFLNH